MVFCRASIARINGGQMNFAVNQMNSAKVTACMNRVRLMFMRGRPSRIARRVVAPNCGEQRVGEREQHREADADDERGVDQAEQQEHLGLQHRVSSGWRAAPSRKRLHMMPMPMQAPARRGR